MKRLSLAEYRIATFAAQGLWSKEIAEAAGVTPNTVKQQLRSIYAKLGIVNPRYGGRTHGARLKLVTWWRDHQFRTWEEFQIYRHTGGYSDYLQTIWNTVKEPVKLPARRRRQDREIPKAA